ncbi:MAG TPA: hypothetical protein VJH37_02865 [Candidatus Nanoarchaeia archaeon]|nr:hypothetical protein [Candidatus Nanoarchaeia archaeon]
MSFIQTIFSFLQSSWTYFHDFVWPRIIEIVTTPIHHKQALWLIVPLLISTLLMQLYFGRNKDEELGWNTAYANSIALIYISVNLLKIIYDQYGYGFWQHLTPELTPKLFFIGIIMLQALLLAFLDLFHSLPKRFSFFIGSLPSVFAIALVTIVVVHTDIPIDRFTLIAALCLFVVSVVFFGIFRWIVPPSSHARSYLERQHELRQTEHHLKRLERYKKIQDIEQEVKQSVDGFVHKAEQPFIKIGNLFKRS